MWSPGIAALLTTLIAQRNLRGPGWRIGPAHYVLLRYALPIGYDGVVYGLAWFLGWGAFTTKNIPAGQPLPVFVLSNATLLFLLECCPDRRRDLGRLALPLDPVCGLSRRHAPHTFCAPGL